MSENNQVTCTAGAVYTVQEGDTFAAIAGRYSVTPGELAELNPYTDVDRLSAGQLLCVPGDDGETIDEPGAAADENTDCPEGYTAGVVQAGETYASLLMRYDISYQAFRLSNPRLRPSALAAGQRYCVPPAGTRRICLGGAKSYVMQPGETLETLAEKLNVTPGRLLRLNPGLAPSDFGEGSQICVADD
ncbi:MAG: LysM peptidoglycan-binding domain-containing protein [Clostridia bacterium]|nr:LysM peptidoglycan-binding domain-containing protein [Clostridia bacterium]MBO4885904.1 LysM peptidoglycan-binding domain-containing protein [Clostridia bacterium]